MAEARVNDYFQKFEKNAFTEVEIKRISKYFRQLKDLTRSYLSNPNDEEIKLFYGLNASQFVKINKLLREFENFETQSKMIRSKIDAYLDTLNFFFKDSSKTLLFKEDTSELTFNAHDYKGKTILDYKDVKLLSSGEQQILILFSYLAFNSEDGKIFIIDEPELSLHIKWQEDFLENLLKVTPSNTQIILATHSPILVGRMSEKAILLYPYNS